MIGILEAGLGAIDTQSETDGTIRHSIKQSEIDALLAKNDNTSSIETQIKRFEKQLKQMDVVASVPMLERDSASNENEAARFIKRFGSCIDVLTIGKVYIDDKLVRAAFGYLAKTDEQSAIWAIPNVLKRGIIIGAHPNHKFEGFQTITIGAPVSIGGTIYNMGVTIRKTKGWRYKMHRVVLSPVNTKKTGASPSVRPSVNGLSATDKTPVKNSIRSSAENSNTEMQDHSEKSEKHSLRSDAPVSEAFYEPRTQDAESARSFRIRLQIRRAASTKRQGRNPLSDLP